MLTVSICRLATGGARKGGNFVLKPPVNFSAHVTIPNKHKTTNHSNQISNEDSPLNPKLKPNISPVSGRSKTLSIIELMRWHKPTGTILALMPSLWSVTLFTPPTSICPDLKILAIFTAGAIVARGMGCTVNDLLDRKFDKHVERTKLRPIACGDITAKEGVFYLAIQSTIGLAILCLNNLTVIKLGFFSVFMISIYPLFKRFTNWPQVMLALTMNWGVIMGCAAVNGSINFSHLSALLPIYAGANLWTLYYDTIYAHQDKTDDIFIGVKSSAITLGRNTKKFLHSMNCGMSLSLATAGVMTDQLWPYYICLASASIFQTNQVNKINLDDSQACWTAFDQQKYIGILILLGALVSIALKSRNYEKKTSTTTLTTNSDSESVIAVRETR